MKVGEPLHRFIKKHEGREKTHEGFRFESVVFNLFATEPEQADESSGTHHFNER